ncbi:hypothetical protein I7I52_02042 [Histoplasma capsulatum]|uniref:Uncharacterized protein n=1 Tax=Ajellomyces capsulatus TaxID=5037 RepID=A0A8H7ZA91_AJECA|nr:hypothetical protein I7I52_02042 [Histoplasma capsulatum]
MRIHLPHKVGYFPAYAPPAPVLHFVMPLADFFFNVPCIWMPPAANRELKALHRLQADVRVHYKKPAEIPVKPKPMKGKTPIAPKGWAFFPLFLPEYGFSRPRAAYSKHPSMSTRGFVSSLARSNNPLRS